MKDLLCTNFSKNVFLLSCCCWLLILSVTTSVAQIQQNSNAVEQSTFSVSVNSQLMCLGGAALLTATVSGGQAPFSYLWSTGEKTSSIEVSPAFTTDYSVVVTDANGVVSRLARGVVTVQTDTCNISNINPSTLICNHGNYTLS